MCFENSPYVTENMVVKCMTFSCLIILHDFFNLNSHIDVENKNKFLELPKCVMEISHKWLENSSHIS